MNNLEPCKLSDVDNTCKNVKKIPSEFFTPKNTCRRYFGTRQRAAVGLIKHQYIG